MRELYSQYRKWAKGRYRGGDGVLVASDSTQEWLLPWWYENYHRHNHYPITWIDLGLTPQMRKWCEERGELVILQIADIFVSSQEELSPDDYALWEERFGTAFWKCRNAWFKKPAAILQSPYERTIWLDTDCEVRGSVTPIFEFCNPFSMRKIAHLSPFGDPIYNSGVLPYRWGIPCFEKWACLSFDANEKYMGDQDILSQIIVDEKISIPELPDSYHRYYRVDPEEGALIIHWLGSNGKRILEHKMIKERLTVFGI